MSTQHEPGSMTVDLSSAPGSDLNFDDLFPIDDEGNQPAEATSPASGTPPQPPPQAEPEVFLKAGSSVYKTSEDAQKGIEHKDTLIDRYRDYLSKTGVDPNTLQPVVRPPEPQAPLNYMQDGKRYYQDLVQAVQKNDEEGYARVQQKFLSDALAPVAPIIADVARQKALRQVNHEIKDFSAFADSKDYTDVLESLPTLRQAIEFAESDLSQSQRLPELYKLAYFAGQGRRVPELVRQAASQQPPATPPTARPTTTPSTMTPPPPSVPTSDWARNPEARKQMIKDLENRGVLDKTF